MLIKINFSPDRKQLRQFGVVACIFFAVFGVLIWRQVAIFGLCFSQPGPAEITGGIFWAISGVCLLSAIFLPRGLWPMYVVLNTATLPIGLVVSHAMILILFFLVITPVGLIFRLIKRDALHRKFDKQAESYWVACEPHPPAKRYFRQF
ncbi:MAG: hypothetical protein K8S55_00060 [Phycisphaerae bacterium]|nr:hypothetical protein [Phycisphaerae bacterium]